jgi:hypothetical protein
MGGGGYEEGEDSYSVKPSGTGAPLYATTASAGGDVARSSSALDGVNG